MKPRKKKPLNLSYSAINTYKQCPRKYFNSQKYRAVIASATLPFGSAVEAGVTEILKGKTLEEAQAAFMKAWTVESQWGKTRKVYDNPKLEYSKKDFDDEILSESDWQKVEGWKAELLPGTTESAVSVMEKVQSLIGTDAEEDIPIDERRLYVRMNWLACSIRGKLMVKAFNEKIYPQVEEVVILEGQAAIQKKLVMTNEDGDRITAYPDYVVRIKGWDRPVVLDLKTATYPYDQHTLDTSTQLKTYDAALMEELNPIGGYCVMLKDVKIKKVCATCGHAQPSAQTKNCKACPKGKYTKVESMDIETQLMIKSYEESELEAEIEEYEQVAKAIKAKVDYRNPESCNNFGRKCEFYENCWGGKPLEEIEHLEKKED